MLFVEEAVDEAATFEEEVIDDEEVVSVEEPAALEAAAEGEVPAVLAAFFSYALPLG